MWKKPNLAILQWIKKLFRSIYPERPTPNGASFNPEHPGISDVTIYGNKDIVCPKCNSPYCQYHFETRVSDPEYTTRLKFHPFNPFKPLVEKKTTVYRAPDKQIKKYRCTRC